MNPESIHMLLELAEREPMVVPIVIGVPLMLGFLFTASFCRVHPLIIWWTLSVALFGFAMSFPKNRRDWKVLATGATIGMAALTWRWTTRVTPPLLAEFRKATSDRSGGDAERR